MDDPLAPTAAERQEVWEQVLHLKPGDLDPQRVKRRAREIERAQARDIEKDLTEPTPHEKQTIESVELILARAQRRVTQKKGV